MRDEFALALACIVDALASSIDPSGETLQRARDSLRDGLDMADAFGASQNNAGAVIGEFLDAMDRVEMRQITECRTTK
ncbi:hypothetical protein [Methylosinus sporium]|uniref:hypothetical protein n=1 Tax=Methylosinus sporium TaxID=428 RepID=UPI003839F041